MILLEKGFLFQFLLFYYRICVSLAKELPVL